MFHSERKGYGVVEYPGLRDVWMLTVGIFEIDTGHDLLIINSNKFIYAEVVITSPNQKHAKNWKTMKGRQIGGWLVYPSGKLFR